MIDSGAKKYTYRKFEKKVFCRVNCYGILNSAQNNEIDNDKSIKILDSSKIEYNNQSHEIIAKQYETVVTEF